MHNPSAFTLSFAFHASWLLMCWYFDAVRRRALSLFQFSGGSAGSAQARAHTHRRGMKCHFHLSTPCWNAMVKTKGVQMKCSPGAPHAEHCPHHRASHLFPKSFPCLSVRTINKDSLIRSRGKPCTALVQFLVTPDRQWGWEILKPACYQVSYSDMPLYLQSSDTDAVNSQHVISQPPESNISFS